MLYEFDGDEELEAVDVEEYEALSEELDEIETRDDYDGVELAQARGLSRELLTRRSLTLQPEGDE